MSIGAAIIVAIALGAVLWGGGVILRERRLARRLRVNQTQAGVSMDETDAPA